MTRNLDEMGQLIVDVTGKIVPIILRIQPRKDAMYLESKLEDLVRNCIRKFPFDECEVLQFIAWVIDTFRDDRLSDNFTHLKDVLRQVQIRKGCVWSFKPIDEFQKVLRKEEGKKPTQISFFPPIK